VRGTDGVAAKLLQFSHAEFLQGIREGRADAGVILMVAGAVKFVVPAVEQKTVRRIEAHSADAKGGLILVHNFVTNGDRRDELVAFWGFRRPENRRRNL